MKKLILFLLLFTTLALCLSFASCKKKQIPEHDHEWDEGTVIEAGDCEHERKIKYVCTICGEEKIETTDGHAWNEGSLISAPSCVSTGTMLYACTKCPETKRVEVPINPTAHTTEKGTGRIVTPPTASKAGEVERVCTKCGAVSETSSISYAEYNTQVNAARAKVDAFKLSDFGSGSVTENLGGSYAAPPVSPKRGQHPRVLFNSGNFAGINEELHNQRSKVASTAFRAAVKTPTDGKLPNRAANFSADTLNQIQILALDYALTKNAISGYNAICAIKNAVTTLDYSGMSDSTRYYGYTMYIAACVYDWCYDLLSDADKTQIVLGVQKKICEVGMEVGFPPSGQEAVTGHGAEFGILRDYLAFAIAIYDEYPGWWSFVAGRFYSDFVPARDYFYEAGMVTQGVSLYVQTRYGADVYSAWLVKAATGTFPYNAANMKQVARTVYSHELPGTYGGRFYVGFNTGDDHVPDGSFIDYTHIALISSFLFDDATIRAELEYYKNNYSSFANESPISDAGVAEYLICSSNGVKAASDRHEGMDLILYNGGWLGQIIARNSWKNDQAAVLMKIGCRTAGNHDHLDAGQFQIFYREMLAGDTGAYTSYGEDHHYYYHQSTIAHNSLLIYNPSFKTNSSYKSKTDSSAYYYTGGQRILKAGSVGEYSSWKNNSKYKTGEVTGVSYGYADPDTKTQPIYAYLAGNITAAYDSSTVSEVTRRMLAVYDTGNPSVPMYFFVFDNITAQSGSYKKTFLLHVPTEPVISGKTVTVKSGNGKLVLQNVIGNNVTITGVGGTGKNYWVNKNGADSYVQLNNGKDRDDEYWGRVEISPATGNATDQLLNVMFVCDADKTLNIPATAIANDTVKGAKIGATAAIFVTNATRRATAFNFTVPGAGGINYYVSGVAAGKWVVRVDGNVVKTVTATEEGGFLSFNAPAGTVTLTPGN